MKLYYLYPQNDFHLHTQSECSQKCPSCKSKTNFTIIQFQPLCTGNISIHVSTRGQCYLSLINNIHSAAEQKNDSFLPWWGWAAQTWSQQWGWLCHQGQKFPSQPPDCSSAERVTHHPSPPSPAVGTKRKRSEVNKQEAMAAYDDTNNNNYDNGKLLCRDVSMQLHAPLEKCNLRGPKSEEAPHALLRGTGWRE